MGGRWARPSLARGIVGAASLFASLVLLLLAGIRLVRALESQGYGSAAMRDALGWLGLGGALLATGIALLIWEVSVRYDIRH